MARAFDGTIVPEVLPKMKCCGTPHFDHDSGPKVSRMKSARAHIS